MPVELNNKGTGNRVDLHPWFEQFGRLRIDFSGNNNIVRILGKPGSCNGTHIQLGNDCTVEIGESCGLTNTFIFGKNDCHITIGDFSTMTSRVRFLMHESSRISIGQDCMIAGDTQFLTSDVHTIYDLATRKRINQPASIEIGDHVWLALQCIVLKGAKIGNGVIVGLRSVVMNDLPDYCLAVGSPARVVREGVSWDRKLWREGENAS